MRIKRVKSISCGRLREKRLTQASVGFSPFTVIVLVILVSPVAAAAATPAAASGKEHLSVA